MCFMPTLYIYIYLNLLKLSSFALVQNVYRLDGWRDKTCKCFGRGNNTRCIIALVSNGKLAPNIKSFSIFKGMDTNGNNKNNSWISWTLHMLAYGFNVWYYLNSAKYYAEKNNSIMTNCGQLRNFSQYIEVVVVFQSGWILRSSKNTSKWKITTVEYIVFFLTTIR